MMFPLKEDFTKVQMPNGDYQVTAVLKDGSGNRLCTHVNTFPQNQDPAIMLGWLKEVASGYIQGNVKPEDIPETGTIVFGFPDTMQIFSFAT